MRNCILFLWVLLVSMPSMSGQIYKDPSKSVETRTNDLLSRMTLNEKVGQLLCPLGWPMYSKMDNHVACSDEFKEIVEHQSIGMLWATFRADPWTKKTLKNGLTPRLAAETANAIQNYATEKTRLGIPVFLAEEAPHGHMAIGTTVFPTGIGLASTWSPDLLEQVGKVIATEVRSQGAHISYGPILDLVRDPRWSRVEETFGEDPVLSAKLGAAMVKGLGGGKLNQPYSVISTLKHFLAYGISEGGQNGNLVNIGQRDLEENFLPPFKAAIDAGALSVMTSYNSIDGVPSTANKYFLTDVLRDRWHFNGFVVSDLGSIEGLHGSHYVAKSIQEASEMALSAGVDVDLGGKAFLKLIDAVKNENIDESLIDTAVARVLRLKFEMGLFDHPYVDPEIAEKMVRNPQHVAVARRAAQESVVLLENKNNLLPLKKNIGKIAVIGPNADNKYNILGDYTAPQEDSNIKTVLDGIRSKLPAGATEYIKGCAIRDTNHTEIAKAVEVAGQADAVVVVVGGSSARDFKTEYLDNGAAVARDERISDMDAGEGYDRATLDLLGKQLDLLKALKNTGKPLIVVYIQGRPLKMNWAAQNADALICAWYPGQEGGNAIADVIFGDYNPAGRLPISIPRHEGQIPVYYNKKRPGTHSYVEMPATPLYSFGYGLSFSTFKYENLTVEKVGEHDFNVRCTVRNTGNFHGDEVVQLYLRDEFSSMVQPAKQLKQFKRVFLRKGEKKEVSFSICSDDFSIVNKDYQRSVEPGAFTLMVGAASDDIRLKSRIIVD
ncbi:glycoside hydrolase family 3 N-terminal domain-containing protein [Thermophagus sp. OGC60D27]|uniref:glycoside hydrolase family 3 N-terminal domain-containing protein n=1 Tax=Thermophagus sp. OGC60D27 TaxID=3458415 RepID=UPI004037C685